MPGNDDAIRSIRLVSSHIARAALEGHNQWLATRGGYSAVGDEPLSEPVDDEEAEAEAAEATADEAGVEAEEPSAGET